jgi:hypothetical protein
MPTPILFLALTVRGDPQRPSALDVTLGGNETLFIGDDVLVSLEVIDGDSVPVPVAGWTVVLDIRTRDNALSPVLFYTASVSGTYNSVRSVNTQRLSVTINAADTRPLHAGTYRYSIKRIDAGSATMLAVGPLVLQVATASQD